MNMLKSLSKMRNNKEEVLKRLQDEKTYSHIEAISSDNPEGFLEHLDKTGVRDILGGTVYNKKKKWFPEAGMFLMLYMTIIVCFACSIRKSRQLMKNEAAMRILGFDAEDIANGLTDRKGANQYLKKPQRVSGLVASTTLVENIGCFDHKSLEESFNKYIKSVVLEGKIDLGNVFILDSTLVETPPNFPGAKTTTRTDDNDVETRTHGFKVFVLISAKTLMPVAVKVTTANESDTKNLMGMVERALNNGVKIGILLIDRGFIDGPVLYQIKYGKGIDFVIPARNNMTIWSDVIGLKKMNENNLQSWTRGNNGHVSSGYFTKGSVSFEQYAPEKIGSNKQKSGAPLNAVAITKWDGKDIEHSKQKVILTSLDAENAITVIQTYSWRSVIENGSFREMKQAATLSSFPRFEPLKPKQSVIANGEEAVAKFNKEAYKKVENIAYNHMLLNIFSLAVFSAMAAEERPYNVEQANSEAAAKERLANAANDSEKEEALPKLERLEKPYDSLREFRFLNKCGKGKLFISVREVYGFFSFDEFFQAIGFAKDSS